MNLNIDWSKEKLVHIESDIRGAFVKVIEDRARASKEEGLLIYAPMTAAEAVELLGEWLFGRPEIKAKDSSTDTTGDSEVSVELSASRESKKTPAEKVDKWRAETKRLSLERQKNAGIYDGEDAVRSMAMTLLVICDQLRTLNQTMERVGQVKPV